MKRISRHVVSIQAPAARVWAVLTRVDLIRQWDDVPEGFTADALHAGAVLEWAGAARLTVSVFNPESLLRLDYVSPKWNLASAGIAYEYALQPADGGVSLTLTVGDWDRAPDGRAADYHEASLEFVKDAGAKIKALAESA